MFNGDRITKDLLDILHKNREQSKLNLILSNYIITNESPICLYDLLKYRGYIYHTYPRKNIDKLANKYKLIRWFHKPIISVNRHCLEKNGVTVHFDEWGVDICYKNNCVCFGKTDETQDIYDYIKRKEREIKLERLTKT